MSETKPLDEMPPDLFDAVQRVCREGRAYGVTVFIRSRPGAHRQLHDLTVEDVTLADPATVESVRFKLTVGGWQAKATVRVDNTVTSVQRTHDSRLLARRALAQALVDKYGNEVWASAAPKLEQAYEQARQP